MTPRVIPYLHPTVVRATDKTSGTGGQPGRQGILPMRIERLLQPYGMRDCVVVDAVLLTSSRSRESKIRLTFGNKLHIRAVLAVFGWILLAATQNCSGTVVCVLSGPKMSDVPPVCCPWFGSMRMSPMSRLAECFDPGIGYQFLSSGMMQPASAAQGRRIIPINWPAATYVLRAKR